jgi:cyclic pyranopterin monophosphate synthase
MSGGMIDVSGKPDTLRIAIAQALIRVNSATVASIERGKSPKGNVVDAARIAGTMAAKRTSEIIPYCHSIPIDSVKVDVDLPRNGQKIIVKAEVKSIWKTGVEMEALTAACIAALTIYDMLKPLDGSLSIESIKLVEKSGGIKEFNQKYNGEGKWNAAVLVMSDSRRKKEDISGKIVIDRLKKNGFDIADYQVIPDDPNSIVSELKRFCDDMRVNLVITSGGTGIGPRDVTPEATRKIIDKEITGVSESIRAFGQRRSPSSMLSRGIAGIRKSTVIVNLPGSAKSVSESLDSLFPGILHTFEMLEGHGH